MKIARLLGGLVLLATMTAPSPASAQVPCTWEIGAMGALSGDYASIGRPIANGIEVAVDEANAAGNLPCELVMVRADTKGDPSRAPAKAEELVARERLVACLCGFFSGESLATGSIFSDAGVLMASTGTNASVDQQGFATWFRAVAPDNAQAKMAGRFIGDVVRPRRVVVIHDGQDYSKTLALGVKKTLGKKVVGTLRINPATFHYPATVAEVKRLRADFVFYGGYTPHAAPLVDQLRDGGVDAPFMTDDGSLDPSFGAIAGGHANQARASSPAADPAKLPAAKDFVTAYKEAFPGEPGFYSADMYDMANIVFAALEGATPVDDVAALRARIVTYFDDASGIEGIVKPYEWDNTGELKAGPQHVWIYRWRNGNFRQEGSVAQLAR